MSPPLDRSLLLAQADTLPVPAAMLQWHVRDCLVCHRPLGADARLPGAVVTVRDAAQLLDAMATTHRARTRLARRAFGAVVLRNIPWRAFNAPDLRGLLHLALALDPVLPACILQEADGRGWPVRLDPPLVAALLTHGAPATRLRTLLWLGTGADVVVDGAGTAGGRAPDWDGPGADGLGVALAVAADASCGASCSTSCGALDAAGGAGRPGDDSA